MRVLCVGRHRFLSEHFCRYFSAAGAECEPVVGARDVPLVAASVEPHVVISDCELLTPALLDAWAHEPVLAGVPVLAVSLTRRPVDAFPDLCGPAAAVYLPALDRADATALLASLHRPRGVPGPRVSWGGVAPSTAPIP